MTGCGHYHARIKCHGVCSATCRGEVDMNDFGFFNVKGVGSAARDRCAAPPVPWVRLSAASLGPGLRDWVLWNVGVTEGVGPATV